MVSDIIGMLHYVIGLNLSSWQVRHPTLWCTANVDTTPVHDRRSKPKKSKPKVLTPKRSTRQSSKTGWVRTCYRPIDKKVIHFFYK